MWLCDCFICGPKDDCTLSVFYVISRFLCVIVGHYAMMQQLAWLLGAELFARFAVVGLFSSNLSICGSIAPRSNLTQ